MIIGKSSDNYRIRVNTEEAGWISGVGRQSVLTTFSQSKFTKYFLFQTTDFSGHAQRKPKDQQALDFPGHAQRKPKAQRQRPAI